MVNGGENAYPGLTLPTTTVRVPHLAPAHAPARFAAAIGRTGDPRNFGFCVLYEPETERRSLARPMAPGFRSLPQSTPVFVGLSESNNGCQRRSRWKGPGSEAAYCVRHSTGRKDVVTGLHIVGYLILPSRTRHR
jgi:hypothetical protein